MVYRTSLVQALRSSAVKPFEIADAVYKSNYLDAFCIFINTYQCNTLERIDRCAKEQWQRVQVSDILSLSNIWQRSIQHVIEYDTYTKGHADICHCGHWGQVL